MSAATPGPSAEKDIVVMAKGKGKGKSQARRRSNEGTAAPAVSNIPPDQSRTVTLGVDYKDTTQAAKFDLVIDNRPHNVSISCPMGELVRPVNMSLLDFNQEQVDTYYLYQATFNNFNFFQAKLRGMHEHSADVTIPSAASDVKTVTNRVYQAANVLQVRCLLIF